MSARQGSASFTVVIASLTALLVGGFLLTYVVYPFHNFMTASALWEPQSAAATRVYGVVAGLWEFWGAIILLAILALVWVTTRQ